ncbi:MAG: exopolysaccharide biosynthesis protein [Clostridia bacterium]|nr:exopolysaccharide biosynthesis protein [Clostridia bacterium]
MPMIDIHCHIIFDVDDGSSCLAESLEMAAIANESGTDTIIATPHANAPGMETNEWGEQFARKLFTLNETLRSRKIPVTVLSGQEIFCEGDVAGMLARGALITLNSSRYPLIEFAFEESAEAIIERCEELSSLGYVPIVAHPERYEALKEDLDNAFRIKRRGCLLQLNAASLFGGFGHGSEDAAHAMLSEGIADFIASDAHSPYMRTPFLADAHEMVSDMYSPDYADLLMLTNPNAVVTDSPII